MPFATAFEKHRLIERVRQVRRYPLAAYAVAVVAILVATGLRTLLGDAVTAGLPFITFFPAILLATLIGGLGPGLLALALSALSAWYFFLPPVYSWSLEVSALVSLAWFAVFALANIAIIVLLDLTLQFVANREQAMRVLVESAPNGIVVIDRKGMITLVNAATEDLFGYSRAELVGKDIELLIPSRHGAPRRDQREAYQRKPEARPVGAGRELSGQRKDGSEFPVEIGLSPIFGNENMTVLATVVDISERKQAENQQQALVDELRHRTQNLFAVVMAVASRTLREGQSLEEARALMNGRLLALSRAHDLLADANFEGAPLAEILAEEFAAFATHPVVEGCDIVVNPTAAQQFAMIIHELATNAVKHGALSVSDGRVSVHGDRASLDGEEVFRFVWKESGGPNVSTPARKGFGSTMLLDMAGRFAKSAALDYAPDGVSYELRIPMSAIEAQPRSRPEVSGVPG